MPKVACPCGFIHDLSPIPDKGWRAIRDEDMEAYLEQHRAFEDGFHAKKRSAERDASDAGLREITQLITLLYECPR